ncbi:DUF5017 domain-containing protein [Haoranjiania flava]|uniref:DUF5017 domain-containing protein n=1 Tax=Haoranjiania flava TaxID=1856322 RepID=A0AAE3LQN9_9BACT|nr:DUF5017 domain-containing protein [Haoranjiania flava]MCU7694650.1 DUF5017 domain-containing protein [Haoranjiania flava]
MKNHCITGVAALLVFASCSKQLSTEPLNFNVETASATYNVGDTVTFFFSGNPDFISFYSGEEGNNYDNRERTTIDGTPRLQFTSYAQYGTQLNTLQLLVSNDFKESYDEAGINAAKWTDITSQATLSTGADNTPSGVVDLSDFLAQKKPVYIAFKYTGTSGNAQKTWTIKSLTVDLLKKDGSVLPVTDIATAAWRQVSIKNPAAVWTISATQLRIAGGNAAAEDNEDWVISKLLYLNNVLPDVAVPVKNIAQKVDSYKYVFSKSGAYKVVFLAVNATADVQQATTKEIQLTIK